MRGNDVLIIAIAQKQDPERRLCEPPAGDSWLIDMDRMLFDGQRRNMKFHRNFFVTEALGQQVQHLKLPVGQWLDQRLIAE